MSLFCKADGAGEGTEARTLAHLGVGAISLPASFRERFAGEFGLVLGIEQGVVHDHVALRTGGGGGERLAGAVAGQDHALRAIVDVGEATEDEDGLVAAARAADGDALGRGVPLVRENHGGSLRSSEVPRFANGGT